MDVGYVEGHSLRKLNNLREVPKQKTDEIILHVEEQQLQHDMQILGIEEMARNIDRQTRFVKMTAEMADGNLGALHSFGEQDSFSI